MPQPFHSTETDSAAPADRRTDPDILDPEPMVRNFGGIGPTVTMLYTLFLENADELVLRLHDRLAAGDLDGARLTAHAAVGAARTAGARRVARLFAAVEEALLCGDRERAMADAGAIGGAMADVRSAVRSAIAQA